RFLGRGGREIAIGQAFFKDFPRHLAVQIDAFGLMIEFVPAEIEPFQTIENGIARGLGVAIDISVVDAEDHCPAVVTRVKPVEDERSGAANVQKSSGRGSEADSNHQATGYRRQAALRSRCCSVSAAPFRD